MTETEFYLRCKALTGDLSDQDWDSESMFGFFQSFRDDPAKLYSLFSDIPCGLEIDERVRKVFEATASYRHNGQVDAYFIVHDPMERSDSELMKYGSKLLENTRAIAEAIGDAELMDELSPIPQMRIQRSAPPPQDPTDFDSLDAFIFDVHNEWHESLSSSAPHSEWMSEAFYSLNCDDRLARYVTWPWYSDETTIEDPYLPYFELWRSRAELRCLRPDDVVLYVPE